MNNEVNAQKLVDILEAWAPKSLAYEWDNVGLQVGTLNKPVSKMMVTLDVLDNVVEEAIKNKVNFIVAHHPLLFQPLKQLDTENPSGRMIEKLIKNDITVYAMHTNLDIAAGGVNDMLMQQLGITEAEVLAQSDEEKLFKLVVFVPEDYADTVRDALGDEGAGFIGNYSHCSFKTAGEGTFRPLEGTDPFIGSEGKLERVAEVRMETIIKQSQITTVLEAMQKAHPYEEAAYDLIPLANEGKKMGVGRIGDLNTEMTLADLCELVKEKLEVPALRVTGGLNEQVKKVAVLGGSGKGYLNKAFQKGADVYITGDMTFHEAQDAWQMGLHVIDPGHHVEKVMMEGVKSYLEEKLKEQGWNMEVITSKKNTEPFHFL